MKCRVGKTLATQYCTSFGRFKLRFFAKGIKHFFSRHRGPNQHSPIKDPKLLLIIANENGFRHQIDAKLVPYGLLYQVF